MKIGVYHTNKAINITNTLTYRTSDTKNIADALMSGLLKCNHEGILMPPSTEGLDAIAFYGVTSEHLKLLEEMKLRHKPSVIIDAGYFGRAAGYLKVSVNYLHPHKYFQKYPHPSDRFDKFNLTVEPMRKSGKYILLAGIGAKSSDYYNILHQSWDKAAVEIIHNHTTMPILYKMKKKTPHKKIPGTSWIDQNIQIHKLLNKNIFAIVTHHSNVAVDGIIRGIPCFVNDGVGLAIGSTDLTRIKFPHIPSREDQLQFLYDVAYTQWTLEEIASGECWKHLELEKLLVRSHD